MTAGPKHFLILDDEESIRQSIAAYMEDDGYIVFQAGSGEEALEIVKNNVIDEAVVDIRLPGMDGNTFMIEARIEHETYGLLATAEKELGNAGTFFSIDNRMFDSYVVSKASDEIVEATTGNGMLPPGEYSLMVTVFYGNDQVETTEYFVLPELSVGIDLIGPGTPLDVEPQLVYSATPYFEWFGEHKEYDFSLYEVLEDQQSPDDIATNLPVFELEKLNATNLLYPSYAELLEERKTYAWQMKSFLNTSSGVKEITSDMYWFMFSSGGKKTAGFEEIELGPDDIDILPGDSVQLKITGITSENEKVKVDCDWKVIPSNGGSVNKDNWFVAGNRETTVAIIATCEGIENYITINIRQKQ